MVSNSVTYYNFFFTLKVTSININKTVGCLEKYMG